jgi:AcrR family transcriptional regulator
VQRCSRRLPLSGSSGDGRFWARRAIIERARVSRKTFYDVFANGDDCFRAVVEQIFARACWVASAAYATQSGWLAATRAAVDSVLCLIDQDPGMARIWFVEALAGPRAVREHRARATSTIAAAIDRGRDPAGEKRQPPELTAEATAGARMHIVYGRLASASREPFAALLGPLMYLIALPYLGAARALAELRRATVRTPRQPDTGGARVRERFQDMNIRLTYRTVQTLGVIAEEPGASNRMVATGGGIKDEGQMSKLLSRLERLGLIENRGGGQDRGGPNAWHITRRGSELVRATNVYP